MTNDDVRVDGTVAPVFDITVGAGPTQTRVSVNGQDITKHLCGVVVRSHAGKLTELTLTAVPGTARLTVQSAIEDVAVITA